MKDKTDKKQVMAKTNMVRLSPASHALLAQAISRYKFPVKAAAFSRMAIEEAVKAVLESTGEPPWPIQVVRNMAPSSSTSHAESPITPKETRRAKFG